MTNATTPKCMEANCQNPARFNIAASLAYPSHYICSDHYKALTRKK